MADMDRFEARFAQALERYADEAPTAIDAAGVARAVAADHPQRGWLGRLAGGWWPTTRALRLASVVQGALAIVVIVAMGAGAFALAERMQPAPLDAMLAGQMDCPAFTSTTPAAQSIDLTCTATLSDTRPAGSATITLGPATLVRGLLARPRSMLLETAGSTWQGAIWVMTSPNGMISGNARLTADIPDGQILDIQIVGEDGVPWGLLGAIEAQD